MSKNEPFHFSRTAEELIGEFRNIPNTDPKNMRRRPTKPIAPLIEELLVKYNIGKHSPDQTVREHWTEIVGASNAAYSHPARIENEKTLVVIVSHAVVRNELFHHRNEILTKIKKLTGCAQIKELNLRAG